MSSASYPLDHWPARQYAHRGQRSFCGGVWFHAILVRDATAAFKPEMMHAAHEFNGPSFAHAIATTDQLLAALA